MASAVAVVMFGAIETSEAMTVNALWHLMNNPEVLTRLGAEPQMMAAAVEESLRLEPAAAVVDRYTTQPVRLGAVTIPAGELVTLSLLAANRDPEVFPAPDTFDLDRTNLSQHVSFVHGPHVCLGLHLARAETMAAVEAVLELCPDLELVPEATTAPEGLIFRKPAQVTGTWQSRTT